MRNGFTLIELMITLVIAVIVLTIAVPSFQTTILNNKLATQTNDLVGGLNLARSEAVTRGGDVMVCKSNSGTACGGNWGDGWLVFADENDDNAYAAADDTLLQAHEGLPAGFSITAGGNLGNGIAYSGTGTTSDTGTFVICDSRNDPQLAKAIVISNTGRLRLSTASDEGQPCPSS